METHLAKKSEIAKMINEMRDPRVLITMMVHNTSSFRTLLETSKGRDKACQLAQYGANLYVTCMKSSDEYKHLVK